MLRELALFLLCLFLFEEIPLSQKRQGQIWASLDTFCYFRERDDLNLLFCLVVLSFQLASQSPLALMICFLKVLPYPILIPWILSQYSVPARHSSPLTISWPIETAEIIIPGLPLLLGKTVRTSTQILWIRLRPKKWYEVLLFWSFLSKANNGKNQKVEMRPTGQVFFQSLEFDC